MYFIELSDYLMFNLPMNKGFKYRIYPNKTQMVLFSKFFGCCRFVFNRCLEIRKNTYEKDIIASPSLRNVSEDDVKRIVEESGADAIVHTAAISDIGICQNNPQQSYIANVMLPVYLAKAAKGRKLVCFSSDQVYSGSQSDGP